MATVRGESSSTSPESTIGKPVVVRVKRKACRSRLDAFWLEINERPLKRPLLDFEKLSISDSSAKVEELKTKKVFVQHVDTVINSDATVDVVQSFVSSFAYASQSETKGYERRLTFKKGNRQDQILSKARQNQEVLAKNARFKQIWRNRKGNKKELHDKALHDICHFYDVVLVDAEEKRSEVQELQDTSLEDHRILCSYLPLLREFIPSAAEEIESDMDGYISKEDDYVYDYYAVKDDMNVDVEDFLKPFPLVRVDDEDFFDGPGESEYDSEDSNAEDNPLNDYPDEISEEEEEVEAESEVSENGLEKDESESASSKASESEHSICHSSGDAEPFYEDEIYDYYDDGDQFDYGEDDGGVHGNDEDWIWSYR